MAEQLLSKWSQPKPSLHALNIENSGCSKIASYDIDWTVVRPKSGKKFATSQDDWMWWHPSVPTKIKQLHDNGFKIVFFTNQAGVEKGKQNLFDLYSRCSNIVDELGIPVQIFISAAKNQWRKPNTMMWDYMVSACNEGIKIKPSKCIYVGDAAGRCKNWKPRCKRDFSCSDRKFAYNIGIQFATPEEHFLNEKRASFEWRSVDPQKVITETTNVRIYEGPSSIKGSGLEVIILVGRPASGKTSFVHTHLEEDYVWVNRDKNKSSAKCLEECKSALFNDMSVVIDNTNGQASTRRKYIAAARDENASVRCFWFQTSRELAEHLNLLREKETKGVVRRIPNVAFNVFESRFEEPTLDEGFDEIAKIHFKPFFKNNRSRKLFLQRT